MSTNINNNELLNQCKELVENTLDDFLAEAREDASIDPRVALTEMAARAIAWLVLERGVMPVVAPQFPDRSSGVDRAMNSRGER